MGMCWHKNCERKKSVKLLSQSDFPKENPHTTSLSTGDLVDIDCLWETPSSMQNRSHVSSMRLSTERSGS